MISRRKILVGAGVGAVSASIGATAHAIAAAAHMPPVHPDAELLALAGEFDAAVAIVKTLDDSDRDLTGDEVNCLVGGPFEIARRMAPLSPSSLEGLVVKLRAFIYCSFDQLIDGSFDFGNPDQYVGDDIIRSLHRDVEVLSVDPSLHIRC